MNRERIYITSMSSPAGDASAAMCPLLYLWMVALASSNKKRMKVNQLGFKTDCGYFKG